MPPFGLQDEEAVPLDNDVEPGDHMKNPFELFDDSLDDIGPEEMDEFVQNLDHADNLQERIKILKSKRSRFFRKSV